MRDWLVGPAGRTRATTSTPCSSRPASPWGPDGRWVLTNGPDVAPLKAGSTPGGRCDRPAAPRRRSRAGPHLGSRSAGDAPWTRERWQRVHTGWDGLVDWSQFCFTPEYRHAVAATVLEVDQPEWRTLEIACTGPFAVWVGGELAGVFTDFGYMEPSRARGSASGCSPAPPTVVLGTWQVAFREVPATSSLRVHRPPGAGRHPLGRCRRARRCRSPSSARLARRRALGPCATDTVHDQRSGRRSPCVG